MQHCITSMVRYSRSLHDEKKFVGRWHGSTLMGHSQQTKRYVEPCRHWLLVCSHIFGVFHCHVQETWICLDNGWNLHGTEKDESSWTYVLPLIHTMNLKVWSVSMYISKLNVFLSKVWPIPFLGGVLAVTEHLSRKLESWTMILSRNIGVLSWKQRFFGICSICSSYFFVNFCNRDWRGFSQWNAGIPQFWRQKQAWQLQHNGVG